ncbi:unnamed protein product, partial [Discosporangium mesarthrocarpum]
MVFFLSHSTSTLFTGDRKRTPLQTCRNLVILNVFCSWCARYPNPNPKFKRNSVPLCCGLRTRRGGRLALCVEVVGLCSLGGKNGSQHVLFGDLCLLGWLVIFTSSRDNSFCCLVSPSMSLACAHRKGTQKDTFFCRSSSGIRVF